MKCFTRLALPLKCTVIACSLSGSAWAAQGPEALAPAPAVVRTPDGTQQHDADVYSKASDKPAVATRRMNGLFGWPPVIFKDTEYGDDTHGGSPMGPSRGYSHFDRPAERYGIWYRPKSFGLRMPERCSPGPFRPRGYGHLFNRQTTCYRMDYHPYIAEDVEGRFGPSYYRQLADPHCPPCMFLGLGGGY